MVLDMYKAEYVDGNFEILCAENDNDALNEAWEYEAEHESLLNVFEIDEDYNEIRTVI
jgi:hypothetical protein